MANNTESTENVEVPQSEQPSLPDFQAASFTSGASAFEPSTPAATGAKMELFDGHGLDGSEVQAEGKQQVKWHHFYKPTYYQPLFDVATSDVLNRMMCFVIPRGPNFFERITPNPDLYGPVWVPTTVLFLLAAVSNLASYFAYWRVKADDQWDYDFSKVTLAAGIIYFYLGAVPGVFWGVQRYFKVGLRPLECYCVYGYSFTPYLFVTLFCTLPFSGLQWLLVLAAGALSTYALVRSLHPVLARELQWQKWVPMLAAVAVLHLALALTFKLYFFDVDVPDVKQSQ
eukprot:TRINITY_DN7137_c0_g1_i1.p1 TRINITY_DN7137_c0_g1~~TRINITY_DN7137_c0_g1_i1.p1  ORF type:complete len:285 (+),score=81.73 TRINITY_DN7137_c0_g1_i1:133-987(+)